MRKFSKTKRHQRNMDNSRDSCCWFFFLCVCVWQQCFVIFGWSCDQTRNSCDNHIQTSGRLRTDYKYKIEQFRIFVMKHFVYIVTVMPSASYWKTSTKNAEQRRNKGWKYQNINCELKNRLIFAERMKNMLIFFSSALKGFP